ncbi:MAG TPA: PEP-CTERM sorting domain-containing protein [Roseateles sp.]
MILPQSRLSRMTLAALATLLGHSLAHADLVVGASSAAAVASATGTPSPYSDPTYSSSNTSISDATGSAYGYAFANAGGAYAVSSYVYGTGSSEAHAQFSNRYYNTSGVTQHYTLSFKIYGGNISAYDYGYAALETTDFLKSGYAASVKVSVDSGTVDTKFSSSATLTRDSGGFSLQRSGTVLAGADDPLSQLSDGDYSWSGAYYTVELGAVAAGSYIDVVAAVDNNASANVGVYDFGGGSECTDSYGNTYYCGYGYGYVGRASSFYGDPLDLDSQLFSVTSAAAQDLPEPASLALVGLAVGAAGLARRKRKQGDGE